MTYKKALAALIIVFLAGCASIPVNSKEITEFIIKPEKGIVAGSFVVVVVRTSVPVEKVIGYLDAMGNYRVSLPYNAKKKAWVYGVPIPAGQPLPRGDFTVRVEAYSKSGEKFTAEKKVSTY